MRWVDLVGGAPFRHRAPCLGLTDITARRNAYGRQLASFRTTAAFAGNGEIDMTFIRARRIESAGQVVEVLAKVDGRVVAARQDKMLVTSFHPELAKDLAVHRYFLSMARPARRPVGG